MTTDSEKDTPVPTPTPGTVTAILADVQAGSDQAQDQLFRMIYAELRRIASAQMRHQPEGHTLQPTALVHEAYLKLMGGTALHWNDRTHFLATASRAMRSILVDHARAQMRLKRAGRHQRVPLHSDVAEEPSPELDVLTVHEALKKFEKLSPDRARVVELRFFGGLSNEETAKVLGVTERTIYRMWEFARAWLLKEIGP
ncbi:MAG: sigma-70 family RNA polymerase sigma factor [Planctomycetota bacterium]